MSASAPSVGIEARRHPLTGWTPWWFGAVGGRPTARWCFTDGIEFTDPFFDQTIDRCLASPFRLLFWRETAVDELASFAREAPGLEPAGFIFHTSRCGSTLIAQMFAKLDRALVMAEAPPFDVVLRSQWASPGLAEETVVDWLRWMVSALGQPRRDAHDRLVIKLDAWAIFQLPLIRRAFPSTPFIFVYRDPAEVLASQMLHRGYHMLPGTLPAAWLGLAADELRALSDEEYCAQVVARLGEEGLRGARGGEFTLVPYTALPDAVPDTIAPLFGIDVGDAERALFARVAQRDAKNPAAAFDAGAAHRREPSGPVLEAVAARAAGVFEALERHRRERG